MNGLGYEKNMVVKVMSRTKSTRGLLGANQNGMLTPRQLAAARALLDWNRDDLAAKSRTSKDTIFNFEARGSNPKLGTVQAWIAALHKAGVELLDETDDTGPGVRLRKRR
jgi:DNA-binding XRE family transcriptional regulator